MLIGIGLWASRRVHNEADFLLAGRNLGPWVAGLSYAASTSSAWVLLGFTGFVFVNGVSALWMVPGKSPQRLSGRLLPSPTAHDTPRIGALHSGRDSNSYTVAVPSSLLKKPSMAFSPSSFEKRGFQKTLIFNGL